MKEHTRVVIVIILTIAGSFATILSTQQRNYHSVTNNTELIKQNTNQIEELHRQIDVLTKKVEDVNNLIGSR